MLRQAPFQPRKRSLDDALYLVYTGARKHQEWLAASTARTKQNNDLSKSEFVSQDLSICCSWESLVSGSHGY